MMRQVEFEQGEDILDKGISLPLFGRVKVVIRRPYVGTLTRIAMLYLAMGVRYSDIIMMSREQRAEFLVKHHKSIERIVALAICRGYVRGYLIAPIVALVLSRRCTDDRLFKIFQELIELLQLTPFCNIIKSAETINTLKRRANQEKRS